MGEDKSIGEMPVLPGEPGFDLLKYLEWRKEGGSRDVLDRPLSKTTEGSDAKFDRFVSISMEEIVAYGKLINRYLFETSQSTDPETSRSLTQLCYWVSDLVRMSVSNTICAELRAQILYLRECRDFWEALYSYDSDPSRLVASPRLQEAFVKHFAREGHGEDAKQELASFLERHKDAPHPSNVIPFPKGKSGK